MANTVLVDAPIIFKIANADLKMELYLAPGTEKPNIRPARLAVQMLVQAALLTFFAQRPKIKSKFPLPNVAHHAMPVKTNTLIVMPAHQDTVLQPAQLMKFLSEPPIKSVNAVKYHTTYATNAPLLHLHPAAPALHLVVAQEVHLAAALVAHHLAAQAAHHLQEVTLPAALQALHQVAIHIPIATPALKDIKKINVLKVINN